MDCLWDQEGEKKFLLKVALFYGNRSDIVDKLQLQFWVSLVGWLWERHTEALALHVKI